MSNAFYEKAAAKFGQALLSWTSGSGTLKVACIKNTHTEDLVNDEFWGDGPSADIVGSAVAIGSPSVGADGVFDGNDVVFPTLSGVQVGALIVFRDTGTPATSPLILWIDTMSGLPFTPNGTDVNVTWDNGSDKIARL